jgi:ubiquinone/menaquinone biosynthesis C-methylase UbiE
MHASFATATIAGTATGPAAAATPDFAAIKARQKAAWASGDYAVVGTTLQIVGEGLCEAADLRAGQRVLDVAAGNGNATLAAARRWCHVTSTDYVPALLERGRERAAAERLHGIEFLEADAEALPFDDGSFDAVLSTFGCMFAPNPPRVAAEMLRACRPGGTIAMANWTPEGFIGQAQRIACETRQFAFRYRSPEHMLEIFRGYYGPVLKAFAALQEEGQHALAQDLVGLMKRFDRGGGDGLVIPSDYLEVVVTRR